MLCIAALLYVDDTDLLHMSRTERVSKAEFVAQVQRAIYYWAKLLQATGGSLKPEKCYWYLLSYKFVRGVACLKTIQDIKQYTLLIPQPNGDEVPIALKSPNAASEVLGIWMSPTEDGTRHLQHMVSSDVEQSDTSRSLA